MDRIECIHDIDVLIECSDLSGLHEKLKERDVRFTGVMFKLYYVTQVSRCVSLRVLDTILNRFC